MDNYYDDKIIDSHTHLWDLSNHYPWLEKNDATLMKLCGNYDLLKRNFLVKDYLSLVKSDQIIKSIHIEAFGFEGNPVLETQWLQHQADHFGFPHGIVARAELHQADVKSILEKHCQYPNVRGIRMALNYKDENLKMTDRGDYLKDKQWKKGFALLENFNLSFDLQIFENQMEDAILLAKEFPNIRIIINHLGWPLDFSVNSFERWYENMSSIAENKNVFMKLSALGWVFKKADASIMENYLSAAIKLFGVKRCMFGSNFPADGLFYEFSDLINIFKKAFSIYTIAEQHRLFYTNAEEIYRLF